MKIAIAIATANRREQLTLTLGQLNRLTHLPDYTMICPASPADYDTDIERHLKFPIRVVEGARGLCAQRNALLNACHDTDLIVFFDDDFYPAPDYLAQAHSLFEYDPTIVVASNHPRCDGAKGPGIPHTEAVRLSESLAQPKSIPPLADDFYSAYGCNMVVRTAVSQLHNVRFDEQLPLYGWLEDIDFSRRMAPHGRIVRYRGLQGVHLGTKRGRQSGVRLGYSQVANPFYMVNKGSMGPSFALRHASRNLAMNGLRSFRPEPWVDRRGRLLGNAIALTHLLGKRLHPQHINRL